MVQGLEPALMKLQRPDIIQILINPVAATAPFPTSDRSQRLYKIFFLIKKNIGLVRKASWLSP